MTNRDKQLQKAFEEGTYVEAKFLIGWGARKKLSKEYLKKKNMDADVERGTRDLLLPDDLKPKKVLEKYKMEVENYITDWSRCLPSGLSGIQFIRKDKIQEVLEFFTEVKSKKDELAKEWADSIEEAKERYKKRYPDKYDESNYPDPKRIMDGVQFYYTLVDLTPPSKDKVGEKEAKEAINQAKDRIGRAQNIILEGFVSELYNNISNLYAATAGDKTANTKVIKTSKKLVTLFKSSLDTFILNDQIKSVVDELDSLVEDDDPSELAALIRDDDSLKKVVSDMAKGSMKELKSVAKDSSICERVIDY